MARETINGISVPVPGTGEPADFVGDLRRIATDLPTSFAGRNEVKSGAPWEAAAFTVPEADDTPTLSIAASSQIAGGTTIGATVDLDDDPHFRYDGMTSVDLVSTGKIRPTPSALGLIYVVAVETVLSSMSEVEFLFTSTSAASPLSVRVMVDGKWVTEYAAAFSGLAADTGYFLKLTFPTAKPRLVRVETASAAAYSGVVVPSGGTATRPDTEVVRRLVDCGDSFAGGANGNTTSDPATDGATRIETFGRYVAGLLQCDSYINLAVGGTGWIYDGGGGKSTYGQRVPEILDANPQFLLLSGSINDLTASATFDEVYAEVNAVLRQLTTVPVIVLTGPERDAAVSADYAVFNDAIKRAAAANGRTFVDTLDTIKGALYNAADSIHPSAYAQRHVLAPMVYAGIDRAAADQGVAAAVGSRITVDVTLEVSPEYAVATGADVTLTATLSDNRAGSVDFYDGGALIGSATVSSRVATLVTDTLAAGEHTLLALFRPTNTAQVKRSTSNAISGYVVSANLGFTDDFNRADGAVGNTVNGKGWATEGGNGTWAIASNKAVNTTNSSGTCYLIADAETPNGTYTVTIGGTGVNGALPIFRYENSTNTLSLLSSGGQILLRKRISNVSTTVATGSGGTWVAGDVISVVLDGTSVTVKKNGVDVTGLVGVTVPEFATATKHGIAVTSTSGAGVTFDDVALTPA